MIMYKASANFLTHQRFSLLGTYLAASVKVRFMKYREAVRKGKVEKSGMADYIKRDKESLSSFWDKFQIQVRYRTLLEGESDEKKATYIVSKCISQAYVDLFAH